MTLTALTKISLVLLQLDMVIIQIGFAVDSIVLLVYFNRISYYL